MLVIVLIAMFVAIPVSASFGVDEDWNNDMNQASYWNDRFDAVCVKFENHSGFIPAEYDAAVVKDGTRVRVYSDLSSIGGFTALGPVNPANGKHFKPRHSWVMKCKFNTSPTTTTTSVDDSTTTTVVEESTTTVREVTTTSAEETTTTSEQESSTSTSVEEETSTTTQEESSTTVGEKTTTSVVELPTILPFTGFREAVLLVVGSVFLLLGVALVAIHGRWGE
jgi:hypothetical protein